jgi:hypothetical protein
VGSGTTGTGCGSGVVTGGSAGFGGAGLAGGASVLGGMVVGGGTQAGGSILVDSPVAKTTSWPELPTAAHDIGKLTNPAASEIRSAPWVGCSAPSGTRRTKTPSSGRFRTMPSSSTRRVPTEIDSVDDLPTTGRVGPTLQATSAPLNDLTLRSTSTCPAANNTCPSTADRSGDLYAYSSTIPPRIRLARYRPSLSVETRSSAVCAPTVRVSKTVAPSTGPSGPITRPVRVTVPPPNPIAAVVETPSTGGIGANERRTGRVVPVSPRSGMVVGTVR